jgi:hypothetical protein
LWVRLLKRTSPGENLVPFDKKKTVFAGASILCVGVDLSLEGNGYVANRVGQQLGNYYLIELLGEGGFSYDYTASDVYLNGPLNGSSTWTVGAFNNDNSATHNGTGWAVCAQVPAMVR